ncbi:SDR family NAD(P)-dependent oxidoreductase [Paraglaciecola sp. MB-3u-78]|jgi:dehydrogenase/reductase SDR family protein 1|uniref:SDR family NAD(P)-dependent oxidoreductase n=1 Tax=Paraglaciecola sp. MB-3u-78 TaxID=2058332 RepID=UPI000C346E82|nr:SDR family NAD(P)-dependent oxidoreductase [Paraglaciecola sp. MB-3u-78]PKG95951.1 short-chain dehydrogenase [Paraglaciecola sp. MB-3u-78]
MKPLINSVALVTGASRGIGKGIALSLGEAGAKVYITGRTVNEGESASKLPGTIYQTAKEITEVGGECIPIQCDHRDDVQVESVFDTITQNDNRLNILVNNVWGGYEHFTDGTEFWNEGEFWTQPSARWDAMFQSGIRAHFIASRLAAPLLVKNQGLIITPSFFAAQRNDKGVAYGTAKAATDHMIACMAEELRKYNVAAISLYPGIVRTEAVMKAAEHIDLSNSESPQFIGRAVVALACDKSIMKKSGKKLVVADLGEYYGFRDIDGKQPRPISADDI